MSSELVEIQPSTLKFTFELRKQGTCLIQIINKTENFVGFKVKTTSPKKYVVKPNMGVIKPKGASDFTVIMLAQSVAPPDLICKDKFLVQSTIVPFGIMEENITSEMFVKDPSKHIEERKLKVILVAPTNSTTDFPVSPPSKEVQNEDLPSVASLHKDEAPTEIEEPSPHKDEEGLQIAKAAEEIQLVKDPERRPAEDTDELQITKAAEEIQLVKDQESRPAEDTDELRISRSIESSEVQKYDEEKVSNGDVNLNLRKEAEDLPLKLNNLGSKLVVAEQTVAEIIEERNRILHEKEMIEKELALARRKSAVKKIYKGYPLLYVCMVAIFSLTFGYLMRL